MTKRSAWFSLRASLWFIPALTVLTSTVSALILVEADIKFADQILQYGPEFLSIQPEGAQQILATIASSMITVVGVVFSVTIVALSLSANQYSPRVLRTFMRDRLNQITLGIFTGGFIYNLLVMQAIRYGENAFVPLISVWLGIVIAILSIFFLIVFIHCIATSIQVADIVTRIARDTVAAMDALGHTLPINGDKKMDCRSHPQHRENWHWVPAHKSGYIQDINITDLFALACEKKWLLRMEYAVGDFVVAQRPLVSSFCRAGAFSIQEVKIIQKAFAISSYRTIDEDPAFGVRQIVDIALRALSPGVNDTTTAINCLDYLGVILHHALRMPIAPDIYWQNDEPRLQLNLPKLEHLIDVALNEIRQNSSGNVAVLLRMLQVIRHLLEDAERLKNECTNSSDKTRQCLQHHAQMVLREAERSVQEPADLKQVVTSFERVAGLG